MSDAALWAALGTALIAMFSAIAVALIQRQRYKPRAWNGQERRTMEAIANAAANSSFDRHIPTCQNMIEVRRDFAEFRREVTKEFTEMRRVWAEDLNSVRDFIINLHGKP